MKENSLYRILAQWTALLLLGIIIGAILVNILYAYRLEVAYDTISKLEGEITYLENKLNQLQMKEIPPKELAVKNITVDILYRGDKIDTALIEKYVQESLKHLIGQQVELIDLELVVRVFNERILTFDPYRCRLRVRYITLSETLHISLEVVDLPAA